MTSRQQLQQYRSELTNFLQSILDKGFTVYINKDEDYLYAYVITPNGHILNIDRDIFPHWKGWNVSFNYIPSEKNGSCCACLKEPVHTLSIEILNESEQYGLHYTSGGRIKRYASPDEFIKKSYHINKGLMELLEKVEC